MSCEEYEDQILRLSAILDELFAEKTQWTPARRRLAERARSESAEVRRRRYWYARDALLDEGRDPTDGAVAERLGISDARTIRRWREAGDLERVS